MLTFTLTKWRARRSGAGLSLVGTDPRNGQERRVSGIKLIETREGRLVATGPDAEITLRV